MQNENKTLYGFMAFGPIGLILLSIVGMVLVAIADAPNHRSDPPPAFWFLFLFLILAGALNLVSMVMFIVHVTRNPAVEESARIGWILGLIFAHTIVTIVYYFMYIVNPKPPIQQKAYGQPPVHNPWDEQLNS